MRTSAPGWLNSVTRLDLIHERNIICFLSKLDQTVKGFPALDELMSNLAVSSPSQIVYIQVHVKIILLNPLVGIKEQ